MRSVWQTEQALSVGVPVLFLLPFFFLLKNSRTGQKGQNRTGKKTPRVRWVTGNGAINERWWNTSGECRLRHWPIYIASKDENKRRSGEWQGMEQSGMLCQTPKK